MLETILSPQYVLPALILSSLIFGFIGAPLWLFSAVLLGSLYLLGLPSLYLGSAAGILIVLNIPAIRRLLITQIIMKTLVALKFLPTISPTEKAAIDAGTVWIDGELFSGYPNFSKILKENYPSLSAEEQAFLDGPVEVLCNMIDDWKITQSKDIPDNILDYLKKERFFSFIIPKEYGGKGFSALANSTVNHKIASKSSFISIVVGVPNSLGPAELLAHYGTEAQKNYYLPRLATGEEIPCFALTEPLAGSDAGAIRSEGTVFKDSDDNLKIRLNFDKRYITLAPLCTLIGLAFKLNDPDKLLENAAAGITCALLDAKSPGIQIKRHMPIGTPFPNGEIKGRDIIIPIDNIIGGASGIGKGWPMLVECLSAGRGIMLPATSTAACKMMMRTAGAYSVARRQFGLQIGSFEGIQEPLAQIAGFSYLLDAARIFTCGGIDSGAKPAVVTAIAKYHFTETARKAVIDASDILAGAAVMMGPKNSVATPYAAQPVGITVEGANIMTRTLMIFGQGAIRCHPYALDLIRGIEEDNLAVFDRGLWKHLGHIIRNTLASIFHGLTRGYLIPAPGAWASKRYFQKLSWASATFAILADIALLSFGGALKRKGMLTGRFGDILSWMYLGTAVLRRYEADGRRKEDLPFMRWSMEYTMMKIQQGFEDVLNSLGPLAAPFAFIQRLNRFGKKPSDKLTRKLADISQQHSPQRDRLTDYTFLSQDPSDQNYIFDEILKLSLEIAPIERKLQKALKNKILSRKDKQLFQTAVEKEVLSEKEADQLKQIVALQEKAIEVDAFTDEEFFQSHRTQNNISNTFNEMLNQAETKENQV